MNELAQLRLSSRAALCVECGKCSTLCPLAAHGGYSAARVAAIRDPERELARDAEAVQRCLTCGTCELRCPQGVRYTDFVRGLRGQIPEASRQPCPHGAALEAAARLSSDRTNGNGKLEWLEDDLRIADKGEIALFVGCLPLFDAMMGEEMGVETVAIARSAVRLLNRLGIEPVIATDERCCGHDLLWSGDREAFETLAAANAETFRRRGVRRILTTCAECCRTWRMDIAEAVPDYKPRIEHFAEFLAERLEQGELAAGPPATDGAVTYHDPCRLSRHLGVVDAPRRLLASVPGTELREMARSGRESLCCGTPGFIRCDAVSRRMQSDRLASAGTTGASKMLTTCPKCWIHFACAQSEDRRAQRDGPAIEIEDLTVFAAGVLHAPDHQEAEPAAREGEAT